MTGTGCLTLQTMFLLSLSYSMPPFLTPSSFMPYLIFFFNYPAGDHVNTVTCHSQGAHCLFPHLPLRISGGSTLHPSVSISLASTSSATPPRPSWPLAPPTAGTVTLSWSHLSKYSNPLRPDQPWPSRERIRSDLGVGAGGTHDKSRSGRKWADLTGDSPGGYQEITEAPPAYLPEPGRDRDRSTLKRQTQRGEMGGRDPEKMSISHPPMAGQCWAS